MSKPPKPASSWTPDFRPRQIRQRLASIGRTPENLTAILITHEHSDHIAGLLGIAEKLNIPIYCNRGTQEAFEFQAARPNARTANLFEHRREL